MDCSDHLGYAVFDGLRRGAWVVAEIRICGGARLGIRCTGRFSKDSVPANMMMMAITQAKWDDQ